MNLPVNYEELHFSQRRVVRERYAEIQKNLRSHCGEPLNGAVHKDILKKRVDKSLFPETFFKYPVHLHHDHNTGMTIGQYIIIVMRCCGSIMENKNNEIKT